MPTSAVSRDSTAVDPSQSGVVLFDLPADRFPTFAADVRRLTRCPLQFRWLPTGDDHVGRVLVKVDSPPELLTSRLLEERNDSTALVPAGTFTEWVPNVWIAMGSARPGALPTPAAGHFLLIRSADDVESIPIEAFVGEIETVTIPAFRHAHSAGSQVTPVPMRLRLARSEDSEPARLWVLREESLSRLAAYCRSTHQHLLARFSVAVSAVDDVPRVVLCSLTAKGPPPVFVGPAIAYRPLWTLANVYLPVGTRLAPTLRRDALRHALGVHTDRIAWFHPLGNGDFRIESIPASAFRPLSEVVDYRVPDPVEPGRTWVQSHRWGFLSFAERPVPKSRSVIAPVLVKPQPASRDQTGVLKRTVEWLKKLRRPDRTSPNAKNIAAAADDAVSPILRQGDRLHHARPELVSKDLERCRELERQFLQALPTLSPEEQTARWVELATAYDSVSNPADAALCWLNALWGQPKPPPMWAWAWLRAEARAARPEVKSIDPGPWLVGTPGPGTTRAMAAWVVWAAHQSPPPAILTERVADLQSRLEAHEHWLPVRAAWLARVALSRLGRGDVLGLARTRDRLSDRLWNTGLSLELDTPSFLRFAGEGVRERFQEARRWLVDRRDLIHQWLARLPENTWVRATPLADPGPVLRAGLTPEVTHTTAYADLILAWGLSRFAEHSAAESIRKQAAAALSTDNPVHAFLREGFEYRITQVRDGRPPRGPLPSRLLERLNGFDLQGRYAVDKLREYSRVLEPTVRVDGYRDTIYRKSAVRIASPVASLEAISAERFNEELVKRLHSEMNPDIRAYLPDLVAVALDRSFELTESSASKTFEALPDALEAVRDVPRAQARLIEKALAAAAAWDRPDVARELTARFLQLSDGRAGWDVAESLTGQTFRSLRRLGLKADADHVLQLVAERVLQGQPLERLRTSRPVEWPAALRVLLHAAAGWYYAGRDEPAHAVLDEARKDLFGPDTSVPDRTALALAYAGTLGQASVRVALGRLEEVFQRLHGISVGGTTNAYYSLKPLLLVETAVRAVVSEEFALGPQVRAWMDADELAIRRRIRDELKSVMTGQGF